MAKYWQESPPILQEFLNYHASILSHSAKTVDEYFLDLRSFFRYLKVRLEPCIVPNAVFGNFNFRCGLGICLSDACCQKSMVFLTFLSGGAPAGKVGIFY